MPDWAQPFVSFGCTLFSVVLPFHYQFGDLGEGYIVSNSPVQQFQNGILGLASIISGGLPANYSSSNLPNGLTLDDLSQGAAQIDRNNLSYAGRALHKHGNRPGGSVYPRMNTKASIMNETGQNIVDDILTAPGTTFEYGTWIRNGEKTPVIIVTASNGSGLRFDANTGILYGFLEP